MFTGNFGTNKFVQLDCDDPFFSRLSLDHRIVGADDVSTFVVGLCLEVMSCLVKDLHGQVPGHLADEAGRQGS